MNESIYDTNEKRLYLIHYLEASIADNKAYLNEIEEQLEAIAEAKANNKAKRKADQINVCEYEREVERLISLGSIVKFYHMDTKQKLDEDIKKLNEIEQKLSKSNKQVIHLENCWKK